MNMNTKLFYLFISCIVVLIIMCISSFFLNSEEKIFLTYDEKSITHLNTWKIESDDLNKQIEMTDFIPQDTNFKPYSLIKTVSTAEYKKPVIIFESMHQTFTVSVNSEIIYEFGQDSSSTFSTPNGGIWHIIDIPYSHEENIIRIDIVPSDDKTALGITDIILAEKSDAILFLISENSIKLVISSIILTIGLALLVAQFFISRGLRNNNEVLFLSLLSINIAIWLISEGNLLQFFIGNTFIVGNLPYWSIQLLLIPFILYIDSMYTPSHKPLSKYLCLAFVVNFFFSTFLHMADIAYYYSTLWIVHMIMLATFLYYIFSLIYETILKKNKDGRVPLLQIAFLILAAITELAVFYFGSTSNSMGATLQTAMLLYLLTCVITTSLKLRSTWVEGMHTEYLSKIAYTDTLTSLSNRHAFERDLNDFKESKDASKIIVTFDLNNLKYFNDNIGHQTGDNYLIYFAELSQKHFNDYGNCYRIGGDEFSAILYDIPFDLLEKKVLLIQDEFKTFDNNGKAGVAVGYAHYNKKEYPNITDYIQHLDECMFKNKIVIKK